MYRWWTVFGWRERSDQGVKFGPVTFARHYDYRGRTWWVVVLLNRWTLVDTYLDALKRGNG